MKKYIGLLVMASLVACSNEEVLDTSSDDIRLSVRVPAPQFTLLEEGQKVGVTVHGLEQEYKNRPWRVEKNGTLSSIYPTPSWVESEVTITAYYPFNYEWKNWDIKTFTVSRDQSDTEGFRKSDLMWATTTASPTSDAIALDFEHKLAKIDVEVCDENGSPLPDATVYICKTNTSVEVRTDSGNLGWTSDAKTINAGTTTGENAKVSAIVVPQGIYSGTKLIRVEMGDKDYTYTLENDIEWASGQTYTYRLSLPSNAETRALKLCE